MKCKKLLNCNGTVVLYQEQLGCGILEVTVRGSWKAYCFFLSDHVKSSGGFTITKGRQVSARARLLEPENKVALLAQSVGPPGTQKLKSASPRQLDPPPADHAKFKNLAENLGAKLPDITTNIPMSELEHMNPGKRPHENIDDDLSITFEASSSKKNKTDTTETEIYNNSPSKERSSVKLIPEIYPRGGVQGSIVQWLSKSAGKVSVNGRTVVIHTAQVWFKQLPALEMLTVDKLLSIMKPGSKVWLNARQVMDGNLQATAVWLKDHQSPTDYQTPGLLTDLELQVKDYLYHHMGEAGMRTNPLAGAADSAVMARVVEYFSNEMGLLCLEAGDQGSVALFHLNQLWNTKGDTHEGVVPYRNIQTIPLQEYLPIGSIVMANVRKLPASGFSHLKYQANALWVPQPNNVSPKQALLPQYISMYQPYEKRMELVTELENFHENFKAILKLSLEPSDSEFRPVMTILNGLPDRWAAEVVTVASEEFGIIKITNTEGHPMGPGVMALYAIFHIEDVYDLHGLPASQSENVSMALIENCQVDLTARPLVQTIDTPSALLDMQRSFGPNTPLLQAVVVCVKQSAGIPITCNSYPKPTVFRKGFGCFGRPHAAFYLNATLKQKLDMKLRDFLELPIPIPLPSYGSSLPLLNDAVKLNLTGVQSTLEELQKIDTNKQIHGYGQIPSDLTPLPIHVASTFSKGLMHTRVDPIYLHRGDESFKSESGVVRLSVVSQTGATASTFAFFQLSSYKFFTKQNYMAKDLVNIMPVGGSEDLFAAHAVLAYPSAVVPYVLLAVWNESLRREMGAPIPPAPVNLEDSSIWKTEYISCFSSQEVDLFRKFQTAGNQMPMKSSDAKKYSDSERKMLPVPPNVARVDMDVEEFDSKQVFVKDGKLVPYFNNVRGEVEHVLSDYHAIIKFKPEENAKFYRVLCSSEDVFYLEFPKRLTTENFAEINPYKFTSAKVCWDMTAKEKGLSLLGIMKVGMEVNLNVVALLSNYPNPAEVHYCTAGVLIGPNAINAPVPVEILKGLWSMSADFKKRFMVAIRGLTPEGECAMGVTMNRNKKFKKIQDGWKKGKIGLFITLKQEYQSVDIVDIDDDENQNSDPEGEDLDQEGGETNFITIPPSISKVNKHVGKVDKTKIYMEGDTIVTIFENIVGKVEKVLTEHIAVVQFQPKAQSAWYRAIVTSDDVFHFDFNSNITAKSFSLINHHKFQSAVQCWNSSAKRTNKSLHDILKPGQKVKMNVLPLLSDLQNEAEIFYCTAGVLVGINSLPLPVPMQIPDPTNIVFSQDFKLGVFSKIIRNLNKDADAINPLEPPMYGLTRKDCRTGPIGRRITLRLEYLRKKNWPKEISPESTPPLINKSKESGSNKKDKCNTESTPTRKGYGSAADSVDIVDDEDLNSDQESEDLDQEDGEPNLIPIPLTVSRVNNLVKKVDKTKIHMEGDTIVPIFENIIGEVEKVITDHIAIVRFQPTVQSAWYRAIATSDDLFHFDFDSNIDESSFGSMNPHKFRAARECWILSAKKKNISLHGILKPGQKVKMNVLPLMSDHRQNDAQVYYSTAGMLIGQNSLSCPVPFEIKEPTKIVFSPEFKVQVFLKIIRSLNKDADAIKTLGEPICGITRRCWRTGPTGRSVTLRQEYLHEEAAEPLTNKSNVANISHTKSDEVKSSFILPEPVASIKTSRPLEDIMNKCEGRVLKVVDKNYAIGVSAEPDFQFLFDTVDIYIGDTECRKLGKLLGDVLAAGDFIKFNAVRVSGEENEKSWAEGRNVKYMATAVVFAKTKEELEDIEIPGIVPEIISVEEVSPDKIKNFKIVANVINKIKLSEQEISLMEKSGEKEAPIQDEQKGTKPDVVDLSDDDDDVQVLAAQHEIDEILKEVNGRELRKIIMSYMELLNGLEENIKNKINIKEIMTAAKIEKDQKFVRKLLMALGKICQRSPKGVKIGHIFITSTQAKTIAVKGSLPENDYIVQN